MQKNILIIMAKYIQNTIIKMNEIIKEKNIKEIIKEEKERIMEMIEVEMEKEVKQKEFSKKLAKVIRKLIKQLLCEMDRVFNSVIINIFLINPILTNY